VFGQEIDSDDEDIENQIYIREGKDDDVVADKNLMNE
jgi:hypothetical protein|tara:strand:+ start:1274 stop:1384 length:111 start_codon:yes stop_codon:yes gene_type:complete